MNDEKTFREATVVFPMRGSEVLLARKTRKIGAGCWNGYGGVPNDGESLPDCAVRELYEESGLSGTPSDLCKIAIMDFHNTKSDGSSFIARVHFYTLSSWVGEYHETDEMTSPTWFSIGELPLDEMMPADRVYLPDALSGKKLVGIARYTPFQRELVGAVEITPVSEFPDV
jgi:8-oxo-dGTP diphosphatase